MGRCCACCKGILHPSRYHPGQQYCNKPFCQRYRRSQWQRAKLKADPDYRANQADAQTRWRASNPDYWKNYRASHPAYVERNRALQRQRRTQSRKGDEQSPCVAKMDVAFSQPSVKSGKYRLEPLDCKDVAKMDFVIVQLSVLEAVTETA